MASITTVALLNAYTQGLSGGDSLFLTYLKNHSNHRFLIITSRLGSQLVNQNGTAASFIITSKEPYFSHVILTYLKRILAACLKLPSLKNYQIIHSSSDFLPDTLPAFLLKLKTPSALWEQKIYHLIPKNRSLSHLAQRFSFMLIRSKADRIFVDNQQLKDDLVDRYRFNKDNITIARPQIDLDLIARSPKSKHSYSAVFVGQLRPSKGIFDLPSIWQQVVQKYPQATLAVIGQDVDDNAQKLTELINQKKLTANIKILGFVSPSQKFSLLKSSPVLVLPSYEEGYGMVIAEGLECGCQPVAYDLPVFKEYFPNQVTTAPVGNTAKFAQNLIKLLHDSQN